MDKLPVVPLYIFFVNMWTKSVSVPKDMVLRSAKNAPTCTAYARSNKQDTMSDSRPRNMAHVDIGLVDINNMTVPKNGNVQGST